MAAYQRAINEMVTCPFDSAHRMLRSKLQTHIVKCRKNHEDTTKEVCPFNATHIIEKSMMAQHYAQCPDSVPVHRKLAGDLDRNNTFMGRTSVPSYQQPLPDCGETWDVGAPTAGYVPSSTIPFNGVIQDLGMMKPAERKNLYKTLHQRPEEMKENVKLGFKETSSVGMRQPRQHHQDVLEDQTEVKGQATGVDKRQDKTDLVASRIAANIFPSSTGAVPKQTEPELRKPRSYMEAVNSMNALNIGRGRPAVQPQVAESYNEDFPALGLGRGSRASK